MPAETLPLTISQKWILSEIAHFQRPGWVTIEFQARTKEPMDKWEMTESACYLADKYETLRVKFSRKEGQWVQEVYPLSEALPFEQYDFPGEDMAGKMSRIKEVCIKERDGLLPEKGNLIRILFFK